MAGIFQTFVKKFITKRVDSEAWGIGPGNISGIRMLTDPQNPNHILGIATVAFDPQSSAPIKPITPASQSDVEEDPTIDFGGLKIPYSILVKKNAVFLTMSAPISSTNSIMTFESPSGTDYQVPAGKELLVYKVFFRASVAGIVFNIAFGDDGVAEGTTDPSTPVWVVGSNVVNSALINEIADRMVIMNLFARIPAEKFPFLETATTGGFKNMQMQGVEVDV